MRLRGLERMREEQDERDRHHGVAYDEDDDLERELEVADRIAEYAPPPPGDPGCRALARQQLGLPGAPYEHPHDPDPHAYTEGEAIRHDDGHGPRPGRIVRPPDHHGLVEVEFGHDGMALVGVEDVTPDSP